MDRSFDTLLPGTTECLQVMGPGNGVTMENVDYANSCQYRWDRGQPGDWFTANPTNDERGNHHVVIRAENHLGEYDYYAFKIMVWSWIISLSEGWNLISVPLVPEGDKSIEEVFLCQLGNDAALGADCDNAVGALGQDVLPGGTEYGVWSYQYDSNTGMSEWLKSRKSGYGDLDTVMPGYGYWVKVTDSAVIKGLGTQIDYNPTHPGMFPSIEVPENGWSLVGRYGIVGHPWHTWMDLDKRVHGFLHLIGAFESVNQPGVNELHLRSVDSDGHVSEATHVVNNEGYWLFVEDEDGQTSGVPLAYTPLDDYYGYN